MAQDADPRDRMIRETDEAAEESGSGKLFDIRKIIGGLFTVYGITLIVTGLLDSAAAMRKADGLNLNLWTGVGMLVFGLLMLLWGFTTPSHLDDEPAAHDSTYPQGGAHAGTDTDPRLTGRSPAAG